MYIVATISKNSYAPEKIEEIILAGATVLRYNFSHGTPEEMADKINVARKIIDKLNLTEKIKIMADLPGGKIRLGGFPSEQYEAEKDEILIFKSGDYSENPKEFIPVDFLEIGKLVHIGQLISSGDGEMGFKVIEILSDSSFKAQVLNGWHIPALKALNIGRGIDEIDHFTDKTISHIRNLLKINPEWVAFSFVNSGDYLRRAKKLLKEYGLKNVKIVSKVESPKGIENIHEIIDESDIILVARGDMGLTTPIEQLGINQKYIVNATKKKDKEVIVSTQILDSLLSYYIPSRAEVLDLTNIVLDGADGIMLAKETGISLTPGYSVSVAKSIIKTVEHSQKIYEM